MDVLIAAAPHLLAVPSDNGYFPIHWAAMACSWETLRRILEADPDALDRQTEHEGWNCLHFAAREGVVMVRRGAVLTMMAVLRVADGLCCRRCASFWLGTARKAPFT